VRKQRAGWLNSAEPVARSDREVVCRPRMSPGDHRFSLPHSKVIAKNIPFSKSVDQTSAAPHQECSRFLQPQLQPRRFVPDEPPESRERPYPEPAPEMKTADPTVCRLNEVDPYSIQSGRELDALIHFQVFNKPWHLAAPCYSTDRKTADELKRDLESKYGTPIVTGKTAMRVPLWFARYEVEPGNPTEVLAETYPLAISRLAVLRALEKS